jgi:DNA-binding transcriptional regulator YiaG
VISKPNEDEALLRQINKWLQERVEQLAAEEIEAARERMKAKIPQFAAEIGLHLQTALRRNPMDMDTYLQILIRPKL